MPKSRARATSQKRHSTLEQDILATGPLRTKSAKRKSLHDDDDNGDVFVDSRSSQKILKIGQDLADEDAEESKSTTEVLNTAFDFESRFAEAEGDLRDTGAREDGDEEAWHDEDDDIVEEVDVDPHDLDMFNKFMPSRDERLTLPITISKAGSEPENNPPEQGQGINLADLILEKIAAHEAAENGQRTVLGGGAPEDAVEIPAKVVEVYSKIGLLLSRYKSGKLPKPFKIIPTLPNWEDLLSLTRPNAWSPNACYEATKIFTSHKPYMTQIFLETIILERVRAEIYETKRLNVHLYNALKKSLYKPAAFFKGFLFPLVSSGTCSLREAHIVASVMTRVSIPVLHSAAALLRLCDLAAEQTSMATESGGATNIFIRTLLDKKYALPYKVVDALVFHFLRFRATDPPSSSADDSAMGGVPVIDNTATDAAAAAAAGARDAKLPVLWHQSLLAFAQRYRNDITEDQREALLDLLLTKGHHSIGPEVRRELLEGRGRGVVLEPCVGDGGDDTMAIDGF
ncbi:MAG: hypothetical protein M1825_004097 [Sarcosagium campestre]|nr:MAG: hypothetical protein M1825_004097 [Sarcosagium campestre]